MRIHTTIVHNANGTAQVKATGAGRQRTIAYDHALSHERNHGEAAGTLALVLITTEKARQVAAQTAGHFSVAGKHTFTIGE